MLPRPQPGAEAAAEVRRVHADRGLRDPERSRDHGPHVGGELRGVVQDDGVAVPDGDGREQPERVVRVLRGRVDGVVHDVGGREPGLDVAAAHVEAERVVQELGALVVEREQRLAGLVGDHHAPCRVGGLLRRVRDHDRDVLPVVQHAVVLQRWGRLRAEHARRRAAEPAARCGA